MNIDFRYIKNVDNNISKYPQIRRFNISKLRNITLATNILLFLGLILINLLKFSERILYFYFSLCVGLTIFFLIFHIYNNTKEGYLKIISFILFIQYYGIFIIILLKENLQIYISNVYSFLFIINNFNFIILARYSIWSRIIIFALDFLLLVVYYYITKIFNWPDVIFSFTLCYFINIVDFFHHYDIQCKSIHNEIRKVNNTFFINLINNLHFGYCIIDKQSNLIYKNNYFEKFLKFLIKTPDCDTTDILFKFLNSTNTIENLNDDNFMNNINNKSQLHIINLSNLMKIDNNNYAGLNIKLDDSEENLGEIIRKHIEEDTLDNTFKHIGRFRYSINGAINRSNSIVNESNFKLINKNEILNHYNIYLRRSELLEINNHVEIIFMEDSSSCLLESLVRNQKDQLKAKLSHEFKTPLISIQSIIDDIIENNKNINELVKVKFLSEILLLLIEDISIDNDKSINYNISRIKLFDFSNYIENLGESFINLYNKDLFLDINIDNILLNRNVYCDEKRIKQVLSNLLSNSIKYSIGKQVKIVFQARDIDGVNIIIEDSGPGLNREQMNFLNSRSKTMIRQGTLIDYAFNKGAGAGFLICKKICKDMNIPISCLVNRDETDKIKGTSFMLKVSLEREDGISENESFDTVIDDKAIQLDVKYKDMLSTQEEILFSNKNRFDMSKRSSDRHNDNYLKRFFGTSEIPRSLFKDKANDIFKNLTHDRPKPSAKKSNLSIIDKTKDYNLRTLRDFKNLINGFSESEMNENKNKFLILIVDDVKEIRDSHFKLFSNVLKDKYPNNNLKIEVLQDGIEIILMVYLDIINCNNRIKLIISDEMMEYINGSDASNIINKITKSKNIKKIPFVICSAFSDSGHMDKMKKASVDEILIKTLQKSVVENIIDKYMKDYLK